jgi:hypothetical protein
MNVTEYTILAKCGKIGLFPQEREDHESHLSSEIL